MNTTMNQKYKNSCEYIYSKNTFKDQIIFFISHNIYKQNIFELINMLLNDSRSLINKDKKLSIIVHKLRLK